MNFNCKLFGNKSKENWHEWFAWHPVQVSDGNYRWLEVVERKGLFRCTLSSDVDSFTYWEYIYKVKGTAE